MLCSCHMAVRSLRCARAVTWTLRCRMRGAALIPRSPRMNWHWICRLMPSPGPPLRCVAHICSINWTATPVCFSRMPFMSAACTGISRLFSSTEIASCRMACLHLSGRTISIACRMLGCPKFLTFSLNANDISLQLRSSEQALSAR